MNESNNVFNLVSKGQVEFENPSILKGIEDKALLVEETLITLFSHTVSVYPDKTALVFNNDKISYKSLDLWSTAIAVRLHQSGIKNGDYIGILYPRGLELHAAILGVLKAGATYVPLDYELPRDRVLAILSEVRAAACLSLDILPSSIVTIEIPLRDDLNADFYEMAKPEDDAYVIYTSGSTGKPKGIPITHRQICHLVRAEQTLLAIHSTDIVYQGFSVSFDMWCEETWISFFVGATLIVADSVTARAIDELTRFIEFHAVTVLHAVPSLLAAMDSGAPALRLINAGGEACSSSVVEKWKRPGLQFFNSYGPTETTVTATLGELEIGEKITIGKPLPNYNIAIVDEQLEILPLGKRGELIITGPGVSKGYINRIELTAEKFIVNPIDQSVLPGSHLYKTGDSAVMNQDGSIDFHGRLDDQIKLRGYRIELGEIESSLSTLPGIVKAAVVLKKDNFDNGQLVAFVEVIDKESFDENLLKKSLAKLLPAYMVPVAIVLIDALPQQISGKIDRQKLPELETFLTKADIEFIHPGSQATLKEKVLYCLQKTFPDRQVQLTDDFFTDLGGHSLLAAIFISFLRKEEGLLKVSLKDLYLNRPVLSAVELWSAQEKESVPAYTPVFNKITNWKYYTCWAGQTIALLFILALVAIQVFIPYLGYYYVKEAYDSIFYAVSTSLISFCLLPSIFSAIIVAIKWLVIGKMKEGDYPLWGGYYFRWWFVKSVQELLPAQFLNGTPIYATFLGLLGVKVASDAQLSSFKIGAEDLVSIGKDVTISSEVILNNAWVEDGLLKLRKIVIEDHAYLGSGSVVAGGAIIKAWGELQDLSFLPADEVIGVREIWLGSPAQLSAVKTDSELHVPLVTSVAKKGVYRLIFILTLLIFPFTVLVPLLPVIISLNALDDNADPYNFTYLWIVPFLSILYIGLFAFQTIVLTRWLQSGIKPGKHSIYSLFYLRKWLADQLIALCLIIMHPIFATVFISGFFRALGAKVGKNTEISTASSVTHSLLSIGSGSFIADAVTLGEIDIRGQQLILENTVIGNNSFVGNSALIPQGYSLPDDMLIGVLSTPPKLAILQNNQIKDWFGSPAIALPNRQSSGIFDRALTFNPTIKTKLSRGIIEFLRIIFPESVILCCSVFFIAYGHDLLVDEPVWKIIILTPFYYLGFLALPALLITIVLKWLLVGIYKPAQYPMWTRKVWFSEAVTSTYEALAVPFLLYYLRGTPWLPILLKLFGLKTGKRVWMNTTDITEFDLVSIGDDTAMNNDSGPQTHLFEDRIMKLGVIKIGQRNSIGAKTIILYDTEIGDDIHISPLSLVMKGEKLPDKTKWGGSPVRAS